MRMAHRPGISGESGERYSTDEGENEGGSDAVRTVVTIGLGGLLARIGMEWFDRTVQGFPREAGYILVYLGAAFSAVALIRMLPPHLFPQKKP